MEKNKIQIWIWVVVSIIIILAIIAFFVFGKKQSANHVSNVTTGSSSIIEPVSTQDIGTKDSGVAAVQISYMDALVKYADRRIQLDKTCQAHPNFVTYKNNTGIMIDNRSAETRTIQIGTTFTIKPWGFKIVVLPDVYLKSKTILVDCGQYQNVATILVQE
jgi:hypothetical protein